VFSTNFKALLYNFRSATIAAIFKALIPLTLAPSNGFAVHLYSPHCADTDFLDVGHFAFLASFN
jgi:hypothetical protein